VTGPQTGGPIALAVARGTLTTAALAGVARTDHGAAAGLLNTGKQAGGALGLAGLAAVAAPTLAHPDGLPALVDGFDRAFLGMAALMIAVAALAGARPRDPTRDTWSTTEA